MLRSPKPRHENAVLLVSSKSSRHVSRGALTWFFVETLWRLTMWKLLIYWTIFSIKKLNKIENEKKCIGIWEHSFMLLLLLLESPWWVRFNRVYFIIFKAKVWKILNFWVGFCCCWKFKQIAKKKKLGLEGKISWALNQCVVHIDKFKKFFNSQNVKKIKNVFTLGPTTQATLVRIESKWKDLGGEREMVKVRMAGFFAYCGWVGGRDYASFVFCYRP